MIYLGADHGGFELKEKIKEWLTEWGYQWKDMGNDMPDPDDDYPKYALLVAREVGRDERENTGKRWSDRSKGILACRSAAGMVIAANKARGARCAACFDVTSAKLIREHNDANIIALSGDWLSPDNAKEIIKAWLETETGSEERHKRRVGQIGEYERAVYK